MGILNKLKKEIVEIKRDGDFIILVDKDGNETKIKLTVNTVDGKEVLKD